MNISNEIGNYIMYYSKNNAILSTEKNTLSLYFEDIKGFKLNLS